MAPSATKLEAALVEGTAEVFRAEPDATTVNKVRKHVEDKLDLEDGFFTSADWKQKSKTLIKEHVERLLSGDVPEPEPQKASKNGTKRQSPTPDSPDAKRQKRVAKPESDGKEPSLKGSSSPERKRKRKSKSKKEESEEDEESLARSDHDDDQKNGTNTEDDASPDSGDDKSPPVVEEEEYSDVIDEPMPKRRKKKDKSGTSSKGTKSSKSSSSTAVKKTAAAAAASSTPDDPDEAEIKKLQSQLSKCGIRKLWHNELKKYGDDARGKIRHLKKMLTDAGMEGRFSEAKAREIREIRELLADAEAAQEMNALWGMDSGARPSRGKAKRKSLREDDSEGSGEEGGGGGGAVGKAKDDDAGGDDDKDDDDEDEENTFAARRRRAQADLAFLGDDSDESSD